MLHLKFLLHYMPDKLNKLKCDLYFAAFRFRPWLHLFENPCAENRLIVGLDFYIYIFFIMIE